MKSLLAALALTLCCGLLAGKGLAASAPIGTITWVEGTVTLQAFRREDTKVVVGTTLAIGRTLRVAADARAEITYRDGSVVRLAPNTRYRVKAAEFTGRLRKRLSADLVGGRLWSRVAKRPGTRRGTFEITTPNAVLGVRGTTWDLVAAADESTEVSVYEGRVGVAPPALGAGEAHEEMAWPAEVTETEWEEIIVGQLQRLTIGPDGKPGAPEPFAPDDEQDPWVEWNLARDAQLQASNGR